MAGSEIDWQARKILHYRLCVRCFRAVSASSSEQYCINDGTPMLEVRPLCSTPISSPYAKSAPPGGSSSPRWSKSRKRIKVEACSLELE
jgi:hypothetical protein